jgi:LmbE family N-acetylglucosaminyl deacetylase
MRQFLRKVYQRRMFRSLNSAVFADLSRPALVFAPHQDDETLGCGGTILRKMQAGAPVQVVFMTDGSGSHSWLIPAEELKVMRRREALLACRTLGVGEANVHFLDFPDGRLGEHKMAGVGAVEQILAGFTPAEVYLPFAEEPPPDHAATNQIVRAALARRAWAGWVFEYPVWFWYHWPWMRIRQQRRKETLEVLRNTLAARFGLRVLTAFPCGLRVAAVLEQKQAALACHHSQVIRFQGDPRWPVLADISNGDFLDCLFQDFEIFCGYEVHP